MKFLLIYVHWLILSTVGAWQLPTLSKLKGSGRKGELFAQSGREYLQQKTFLHNSLTRSKQLFEAIQHPKVSFYSCGPTVYDFAHIGNFRAFLTYDLLKRWLKYIGYDVTHICNLTDIDDKIIARMAVEGKSLREITTKYTDAFFDDLKVLNIIPANRYPKATEYVNEIEEMVSKLIEKQNAYSKGGSVYFKVSSFPDYGKLANLSEERLEGAGGSGPNARRGEADKEDSRDFALWKAFTSQDGEVFWDSPKLGKGRPGWHIECSAMAYSLLGPCIDIHSGGVDLVFPHHSNEIAQSEAFTGQTFARYWVHNGFVNINNEKMSKSLKNFKTLRDIVQQPSDARAFRYLIISAQYRNPLNFNDDSMTAARNSLKRIDKAYDKLSIVLVDIPEVVSVDEEVSKLISDFDEALADDLNTPRAMASLFQVVKLIEKLPVSTSDTSSLEKAATLQQALSRMDGVLGLRYEVPSGYFQQTDLPSLSTISPTSQSCACGVDHSQIMEEVKVLAEQRAKFKAEKNFAEADQVRDKIRAMGYDIKDFKGGFDIIPYSSNS